MRVEPFSLERFQSIHENTVAINLAESGVQPLSLGELVEDAGGRDGLLAEVLKYPQTNGSVALRAAIAALHAGAGPDHVQVTNGGSEANFVTLWRLVEPGDEVVVMTPTYLQTPGLARAFGATVREWPLVLTGTPARWQVDVDALARLVTPRTRLIIVCNPNNPTGARVDAAALDAIAAVADRHGAWILSDEIYRGAERDGTDTASMWGRGARVVVTGGLSKAYGLPGLRIGWAVGPPDLIASLWTYHDYTSIAPGALSDTLAIRALQPANRARLLARTRRILQANWSVTAEWLDARGDAFSYAPPDAGAIVFPRYRHAVNSTTLVEELRVRHSVLMVAGDHFGMDGYLRIGFGESAATLREGLKRLAELLAGYPLT